MRERLTYANVMSTIAVFIALGGSSYAAVQLSKNSVRSKHIKNGQIKRADLGRSAVDSTKVKDGSLRSSDFAPGQLPAAAPGAKGETGAPGPQGAMGPTGPSGFAGPGGWAHEEVGRGYEANTEGVLISNEEADFSSGPTEVVGPARVFVDYMAQWRRVGVDDAIGTPYCKAALAGSTAHISWQGAVGYADDDGSRSFSGIGVFDLGPGTHQVHPSLTCGAQGNRRVNFQRGSLKWIATPR